MTYKLAVILLALPLLAACVTSPELVTAAPVVETEPAQQQQPPCADRAKFLNHLSANYKEAPVAMGLTANGAMLEVLASEGGSWTIIVTTPNGISCGVASGMSWEQLNKTLDNPSS